MPTSATHITILEMIANSSREMTALLGNVNIPEETNEIDKKMRFAKLGSIGPDFLYTLGDYNEILGNTSNIQLFEEFMVRTAGSLACLGELIEQTTKLIDGELDLFLQGIFSKLKTDFDLITASINEGIMALIVGPAGTNFFSLLEPPRQKDAPRENWFWVDYLHYVDSGKFTKQLIINAKKSKQNYSTTDEIQDLLIAYAYGYFTHYVSDTVGHPFVNQITQAPWRLYWQRHHLVENFIDAYVWDNWHTCRLPKPSSTPPQATSEEDIFDQFNANARNRNYTDMSDPSLDDSEYEKKKGRGNLFKTT